MRTGLWNNCSSWWLKGTVKWWTKWKCFRFEPYLNSLIKVKLPFSQQEYLQIFQLPLPSKTCVLPSHFLLERDTKSIFYYQHDMENCTYQALDFLLLDKYEYRQGIFQLILVSVLNLFCFSRFYWQNRFLFSDNSILEELVSHWLQALYITGFFQWKYAAFTGMSLVTYWWLSNVIIYILVNKGWFSYVRVFLKLDKCHICVALLSLKSL